MMFALLRLCILLCVLAPALGHAATLGIPGNGAKLSGVGVISGWKCAAEGALTIVFNDDGQHVPLLYGSQRPDVLAAGACDHDRVGFVAIWNWAELGDGEHTAIAYDNGIPFARSTFTVITLGTAFVRDAVGECTMDDFPVPGETATFTWNQATQHLELVEAHPTGVPQASYDPAYWRQVERDIAAGTYLSERFIYASLPDLDACRGGVLTQAAKDRALEGINQIRALHGLAAVRYSFLYDTSVQEGALIMAANHYLTHSPNPSDRCYTEAGAEGLRSNINFTSRDPSTGLGRPRDPVVDMLQYTNDSRGLSPAARREFSSIAGVGHRRGVLSPFAAYMSYGQVYGFTVHKFARFDREPDPYNLDVDIDYVAFPYDTYPATLMFSNPSWSFELVRYGGLEGATISVTRVSDGTNLTVSDLYTSGEYFLSWTVEDWEFDTLYQVEINNVAMQSGGTRSYSYPVYIDRAGLM